MKNEKYTYTLIGIIGTLLFFWIYSNIDIKSGKKSSLQNSTYDSYEDEMMKEGYLEVVEDAKTRVYELCSGVDIETDNCTWAIQSCLDFKECLQMVEIYKQRKNISVIDKAVIIEASKEYINQIRTEMGLPPVSY